MPLPILTEPTFRTRLSLRLIAALVILFAATAAAGWAIAAEGEAAPSDQQIANAVSDELLEDPGVSGNRIDVTAADGIVTLSGTVPNLLGQERAIRIAETIKGVRAVIDRIEVKSRERDDEAIAKDVKAALSDNPRTEAYEIAVTVDDGTVSLGGVTQSQQERQLVGWVAKSVKGVQEVENRITVEPELTRPDEEILEDVKSALEWDRLVDNSRIDIQVENGEVTLSGTTTSAAELRRARANAWVAGVNAVDASALEVNPEAGDQELRREKYADKSDAQILEAIQDTLALDPRVDQANITIAVVNGIVTLRGSVDTLTAKQAAAANARNTVGVWRVKNRLRVRPGEETDDAQLATLVRNVLLRDPYVDRYEITVMVNDGRVTLSGVVDTHFEKAQAEDVVSSVSGVVEVNNDLSVIDDELLTYDPYVDERYTYDYPWYDYYQTITTASDWEIRDDIEDELFWSPFVDSDDIVVTVDDGVATLTGMVDTWAERRTATENALEGGAIRVNNKLDVEYGPDFDLF